MQLITKKGSCHATVNNIGPHSQNTFKNSLKLVYKTTEWLLILKNVLWIRTIDCTYTLYNVIYMHLSKEQLVKKQLVLFRDNHHLTPSPQPPQTLTHTTNVYMSVWRSWRGFSLLNNTTHMWQKRNAYAKAIWEVVTNVNLTYHETKEICMHCKVNIAANLHFIAYTPQKCYCVGFNLIQSLAKTTSMAR